MPHQPQQEIEIFRSGYSSCYHIPTTGRSPVNATAALHLKITGDWTTNKIPVSLVAGKGYTYNSFFCTCSTGGGHPFVSTVDVKFEPYQLFPALDYTIPRILPMFTNASSLPVTLIGENFVPGMLAVFNSPTKSVPPLALKPNVKNATFAVVNAPFPPPCDSACQREVSMFNPGYSLHLTPTMIRNKIPYAFPPGKILNYCNTTIPPPNLHIAAFTTNCGSECPRETFFPTSGKGEVAGRFFEPALCDTQNACKAYTPHGVLPYDHVSGQLNWWIRGVSFTLNFNVPRITEVPVWVTCTRNGYTTTSNRMNITVVPKQQFPIMKRITPKAAFNYTATWVTIEGSGFVNGKSRCQFDYTLLPLEHTRWVSSTKLMCLSPAITPTPKRNVFWKVHVVNQVQGYNITTRSSQFHFGLCLCWLRDPSNHKYCASVCD
eukprot:TRINITY_DN32689_c0_g2_i1.p1 TRINITY_DN32689_c0_g2~~TRINITY_DN32689_c0_g2_i1.p1  ORF type:complete len:433 (-),score=42.82 TRINITY_DN32689_c0_g2_i1:115-1413(-)